MQRDDACSRPDRRLKITIFSPVCASTSRWGHWPQVHHGFIMGDTPSRAAATQSVLIGRDPHPPHWASSLRPLRRW